MIRFTPRSGSSVVDPAARPELRRVFITGPLAQRTRFEDQVPAALNGGRIETPYGALPAAAGFGEQPSVIYLRPEQFVLDQSATTDPFAGGRIERTIPEGATTLYLVRTADGSTTYVRTLSTEPIEIARAVTLRLRGSC